MEFWTLAVVAGWNEPPLMGIFHYGLNRRLQDTMALQGRPKEFNNLITLATELDNYLGEQRQEQTIVTRASYPSSSSLFRPASSGFVLPSSAAPVAASSSSSESEPMQVGQG